MIEQQMIHDCLLAEKQLVQRHQKSRLKVVYQCTAKFARDAFR